MHVCVPVCSVPLEARRGHWITWTWSYKQLWAAMWCWELNVVALEEKPVLLTIRPCLRVLGKEYFVVLYQDRLLGCLRRNSCLVSSQGTKYFCIFSMESVTGSCWNQMLSTGFSDTKPHYFLRTHCSKPLTVLNFKSKNLFGWNRKVKLYWSLSNLV